ncbi:hypothetical protein [Rickettsia endosymbiont of Polydrusus tereticollis]|uniref:hypothetical protein n=1 Tax=Rickettsia endosymbiont of Polydrusus tereticollis TaxID=3066251 RepID=UPI003132FB55
MLQYYHCSLPPYPEDSTLILYQFLAVALYHFTSVANINTDKERNLLMEKLANNNLSSVKPIKRVYIPKRKGKLRPLGLPIILDRCMQAVVKSPLDHVWTYPIMQEKNNI